MKISIVSFQKHRNVELEAAEQEYIKRLSLHAKVEVHALKNWDETAGLPEKFLKGTRIVGLFIDGKMSTSEQLAGQLQQWMNAGTSHIVLVIGAAEGMPAAMAGQMQERWSLSRLTFSHQLVRLLLLEVLYRSFDILQGGRYHK